MERAFFILCIVRSLGMDALVSIIKNSLQVVTNPRMMYDVSNFFGHMRSKLESSLVGVTQPLVSSIHQLVDGVLVQNAVRRDRRRELQESLLTEEENRQLGTHVHVRRNSDREIPVRDEILSHGNRASAKCPEIGRVGILPVVPELVDHL